MELNEIFLKYHSVQPERYTTKESSHGNDDFRLAAFPEWPDEKIVVKITCNDFTTPERIKGWHDTIGEYRLAGYYCPRIIPMENGEISMVIEYAGKSCVVYAEEYSKYRTAENFGESIKINSRFVYHDAAVKSIGVIGSKHLTTADWPSGYCILEAFSPSDLTDEVMETALSFKKVIEEDLPAYQNRFSAIWEKFIANREKLKRVYSKLPTSVFQADLNHTNILLNDDMTFVGLLDFNLCGRDTVLNYFFRESMVDFREDVYEDDNNKRFYSDEINLAAFDSLVGNIDLIKQVYFFSDLEKKTAPLIYRYLRPFWWQPDHELKAVKEDPGKVTRLLDWIDYELTREDIDFAKIMS